DAGGVPPEVEPAGRLSDGAAQLRRPALGLRQEDRPRPHRRPPQGARPALAAPLHSRIAKEKGPGTLASAGPDAFSVFRLDRVIARSSGTSSVRSGTRRTP